MLRLDPDAAEVKLVFGASASNDKEVAVVTRSLMQQMSTITSQVDTPAEDISQDRAAPGWEAVSSNTNAVRLHHDSQCQSQANRRLRYYQLSQRRGGVAEAGEAGSN